MMLLVAGVVSAAAIYRSSANDTTQQRGQSRRVPLAVLQAAEPVISGNYTKKPLLAPSKDGQSLYSLDSTTGELNIYERKSKHVTKVANSFSNTEAFAVGPQGDLYIAQSDSTVQIVSADGRRLNAFRTVYPRSIAVLGNGNVVVASPFNGKTLHLYNGQGLLLASFGELKAFDNDQRENEFLNEGRVVVGSGDEIYYVSTYAPRPYVARFSHGGQLLSEFLIEGDAVDLQTGFTTELLNRRALCVAGVLIITSASVHPDTGHLWLGMNGLSTQATVYEYDPQTGTKIREYAFLLDSKTRKYNVTHVKDIAVSGDSLSILTWGGTYVFKVSDPLIVDAWKVPIKSAPSTKPTWTAWANPFAKIFKSEAPPILRPGIPQPPDPTCESQPYPCVASCPAETTPASANCGAETATLFPSSSTKRVIFNNCTQLQLDSTPGATAPGGCDQTVNWCDTFTPFAFGSETTHVRCTATPIAPPSPTPSPEPTPSPSPEGGGSGGCPNGTNEECVLLGCYECVCYEGMCSYATPILIDVSGNGFDLTNPAGGVDFDLNNDGVARRVAWTAMASDDGWLVLDRNGNGLVDSGTELFGDVTPQPLPPSGVQRNGFLALAEFDKPANGGNGDGKINRQDAIFNSLKLWQDTNHNGISESSELHRLGELGLAVVDLDYKESRRRDEHGNWFRYRAKVRDTRDAQLGRWAWDVLLVSN